MSSKNKTPAKKSKPAASKKSAKKPAKKPVRALKGKSKPKPKKKSPLRKTTVQAKTDQPKVSYLFTEHGVTVNFPWHEGDKDVFRTKTVLTDTPEYEAVRAALRTGNMQQLVKVMTRPERIVQRNIARFKESHIELRGSQLLVDGRELPTDLGKRIVTYAEQGLPYDSLVKFWRKLVKNPSRRAVTGLFRFLDANHFPITDDGNFIAYKGVNENWTDCHTGTMDNSVGKTVEMPRNMVDEDPEVTCSTGIHCASYKFAHDHYGAGHGGRTIIVSVDPSDVVAVPHDYESQKMRVCKYVVVAESQGELTQQVVSTAGLVSGLPNNDNNDNYDNLDNNNDNVDNWDPNNDDNANLD